MVKFIEVNPDEIDNTREAHRGRVSYPILKSFLETNLYVAQLDRTGIQTSFQALYSSLNSYIRNHNLPIKLFSRAGLIYLMRLDIDKGGNIIPDWGAKMVEAWGTPLEITPEVVTQRFEVEKEKATK